MNIAAPQIPPIPLVVLTGFLGSGKTTLLNRVLADPSMQDTAVIVNEFGEIGIDHLLVESVVDDVVLLASGCVCCSAGDDLGAALASILTRRNSGALPPFQRVVLETTGIADPGSVLQRLLSDGDLAAQIRIQAVVTVVDAVFGEAAMGRYPESASQVAMANRLVISKLDLIERNRIDSLLDCLQSVNPVAPVRLSGRDEPAAYDVLFGDTDAGLVYNAISSLTHRPFHQRAAPDHTNRYSTYCLSWDEPTNWYIKGWLEGLLIARGDSILRMKGVLQVAGRAQPVVVQGVQHALYPPKELARWPQEAHRSELRVHHARLLARRGLAKFLPVRSPDLTVA